MNANKCLTFYFQIVDGTEDIQYRLLHVFPCPTPNTTRTRAPKRKPVPKNEAEKSTKKKPLSTDDDKSTSSPSTAKTTTKSDKPMALPRSGLTEAEVGAIFEILHGNDKELPSHLKFQVVPISNKGRKLSPPQLHFEGACPIAYERNHACHCCSMYTHFVILIDGLYVLCETVPEHLLEYVGETPPPSPICWRPSGPSKSKKYKIRYCYPMNRTHATKKHDKSGFLWTKVR